MLIRSEFVFADGYKQYGFVFAFKQIDANLVTNGTPGANYYALKIGVPYLNFALGREAVVRVIEESAAGLVWLGNDGARHGLAAITEVDRHALSGHTTCACNSSPEEIVAGWVNDARLPDHLRQDPF